MKNLFSYKIDDDTELFLIEPRHAKELNALIENNKAHIKKWSPWLKDDRSIESTHIFIKRNLKNLADGEGFAIGIRFRGEMAGQIDFSYFDWINLKTEIGYFLGESFQGKGLVTKSCRVLIEYAFDELKLNRVEMRCGVENKKSRKIPEKLGFKEEGIIRQTAWLHDHFVDYVIYGLLADEWKYNNNP